MWQKQKLPRGRANKRTVVHEGINKGGRLLIIRKESEKLCLDSFKFA